MARLDDIAEPMRSHLRALPCQSFDETPWAEGPPLKERRVALISTAGLQRRGDRPFAVGANDYRVIPADIPAGELIISHISTNFDRTGFYRDLNVVFPIDRLRELKDAGVIGSIASRHFGFMGATPPHLMEPLARDLAAIMRDDAVGGIVLCPV